MGVEHDYSAQRGLCKEGKVELHASSCVGISKLQPNGMAAFWGILLVGDMLTCIKKNHGVKSHGKGSRYLSRGE